MSLVKTVTQRIKEQGTQIANVRTIVLEVCEGNREKLLQLKAECNEKYSYNLSVLAMIVALLSFVFNLSFFDVVSSVLLDIAVIIILIIAGKNISFAGKRIESIISVVVDDLLKNNELTLEAFPCK